MEKVILVDEHDNVIGTMDKMEAHQKGVLHRAFSILVFNSKGEMLLQKRSKGKYHSGGLWTNSCCSHPGLHESIEESARRRLKHEMGIDLEPEFAYKFLYKSNVGNNITEHELDHVFTGVYDGIPSINTDEVEDWKFVNLTDLRRDIETNPDNYTTWFKLIVDHPDSKLMTA
jgi:isopentenyl-diphosphate delta-isomerase